MSSDIASDDPPAVSVSRPQTAAVPRERARYACDFDGCGKSYNRLEHLTRHQLNHNPVARKFICPDCGKKFVRGDLLRRHMPSHKSSPAESSIRTKRRKTESDIDASSRSPVDADQDGSTSSPFSATPGAKSVISTLPPAYTLSQQQSDRQLPTATSPLDGLLRALSPETQTTASSARFSAVRTSPLVRNTSMPSPSSSSAASASVLRRQSPNSSASVITPMPTDLAKDFQPSNQQQDSSPSAPEAAENNTTATANVTLPAYSLPTNLIASPTITSPGGGRLNALTPSAAIFSTTDMMPIFGERDVFDFANFPFDDRFTNWLLDENSAGDTNGSDISSTGGTANLAGITEIAGEFGLQGGGGQQPYDMFGGGFGGLERSGSIGEGGGLASLPSPPQNGEIVSQEALDRVFDLYRSSIPDLAEHPHMNCITVSGWVHLYWKHFHPQYPILHKPTSDPNSIPPHLLVAMFTLGTRYDKDLSSLQVSVRLHMYLRTMVYGCPDFVPPAKLWVFQTLLLGEMFEKVVANRHLHEMSHVFHGTLITLMRRGSSLINPELTAEDSTTTTAKTTSEPMSAVERHWKTWIKTEATIRTAFFAFIVDIQHAEMFGHTPALYANELSLDLPCDDELWNASDAERWGMLMKSSARSSGGRKRTSFFSSLKLVMSHGWNRLRLNPFGRYIVLHGLLSISWTMRQRGIISIGISSKEKKDMSETASPRGSPPPPQQQQQTSGAETGTRQGGLIAQAVNRAASVVAASSPADAMKEGGSNNTNGEGTEAAGSPAVAAAAGATATAAAGTVSTTAGDWTSVIYKAFETWKLAFDLSESENPSASGIPFILASSSLHRLGIIRLYTDVLQLHVYAGLSHVLGRPIRAQDWLRAEDAMKAWARSPGSYLSVWHASRLVSGAFLGQAGQYSADNDVVLHRPWCLYLGCLVLWAYGYAMEDCSRKYSDYVAVKAAAAEEEGEGERERRQGSNSYYRFGKFPSDKRSRPSGEATAAAPTTASAPEFIHTTTPSWNAREDMERYLESLLAVSEPADIPKLATKNCTIGLMAYAGELFRSCRWTLLGEEAAYHCSRLACAIPVRS